MHLISFKRDEPTHAKWQAGAFKLSWQAGYHVGSGERLHPWAGWRSSGAVTTVLD